MKVICPNPNDEDVLRIWNGVLARLGGKPMTAEDFKNKAYKEGLSPEELNAYHKAYFHWNAQGADGVKIHDYLNSQDAVKNALPVDLIKNLEPIGPKKLISDIVEGVEKVIHPDIRSLGKDYLKMYDDYKMQNKDMGLIEKYTDLPSGKASRWPQWREAWDIMGSRRTEGRNELSYKLQSTMDNFLTKLTKPSSVAAVERIAFEGDRTLSKRYSDLHPSCLHPPQCRFACSKYATYFALVS